MNCPICDFLLPDDALRCRQCNSVLTVWKNLDLYARQRFAAGLHLVAARRLEAAVEMLLTAVIFAPGNADYAAACGRVLAQLGRYAEAQLVLEKAGQLAPTEATRAALEKVRELAAQAVEPTPAPSPPAARA
jgi:tetratricopeptide (TPR) repeat protein